MVAGASRFLTGRRPRQPDRRGRRVPPFALPQHACGRRQQEGGQAGDGEGFRRAETADEGTADRRSERRRDHDHRATRGEDRGQVGSTGRGLEEGIGQRNERSVDQPTEGEGDEGDRDRSEGERDQARPPAGHDEERDPAHVAAADGADDQVRRQGADPEGCPVGAEQPWGSLQVDGHVHRQGDLHRTVQKEEDPGHERQAQQIRAPEESEPRFRRQRIDGRPDGLGRRAGAPGNDAEERE
jgi:hypothetical protein